VDNLKNPPPVKLAICKLTTALTFENFWQASKWLTNYLQELKCPVEVTTQQDAKFIQKLELSVRFGKTLVIQEVDR
jgi:hypothetical protein